MFQEEVSASPLCTKNSKLAEQSEAFIGRKALTTNHMQNLTSARTCANSPSKVRPIGDVVTQLGQRVNFATMLFDNGVVGEEIVPLVERVEFVDQFR